MRPRLRRAPTAPSTTGYWLDNDTAIFWLFTVMIIIACERLLIHGGYNLWNALSSMMSSRSASSLPRTSVSSTSTQTETVYVNAIVENRRNINELKRRDDRIRELEARLDQRSHSDRRKFYAALQLDDFTTRRLNCEAYKVGSKITSLHARQAVLSLLPRTQDAGTAVRNAAS